MVHPYLAKSYIRSLQINGKKKLSANAMQTINADRLQGEAEADVKSKA